MPEYLGAEPGITLVLHTWEQDLSFQPHLHCIVSAGGFDGKNWRNPKRKNNRFLEARTSTTKGQYPLSNPHAGKVRQRCLKIPLLSQGKNATHLPYSGQIQTYQSQSPSGMKPKESGKKSGLIHEMQRLNASSCRWVRQTISKNRLKVKNPGLDFHLKNDPKPRRLLILLAKHFTRRMVSPQLLEKSRNWLNLQSRLFFRGFSLVG